MKLTHTLPMAGAALALLAFAGGAQAQTTTPDPALSLAFADDGGRTSLGGSIYVASQRNGIGFQNNPGDGGDDAAFIDGTSSARLQSFFNPFQVGANIASGQNFQIGVHGDANNLTNPAGPVTVFASIYHFNANAASGTVPIGSALASDIPILIASTPNTEQDQIFYSGDVSLPSNLLTGSEYIIGFTPISAAGGAPANFAFVDGSSRSASTIGNLGVPSRDKYETVNQIGSPAPTASNIYTITDGSTNPLGFRLYGVPGTSPVPEASTVVSFGVLLAFGGLILLRRRAVR